MSIWCPRHQFDPRVLNPGALDWTGAPLTVCPRPPRGAYAPIPRGAAALPLGVWPGPFGRLPWGRRPGPATTAGGRLIGRPCGPPDPARSASRAAGAPLPAVGRAHGALAGVDQGITTGQRGLCSQVLCVSTTALLPLDACCSWLRGCSSPPSAGRVLPAELTSYKYRPGIPPWAFLGILGTSTPLPFDGVPPGSAGYRGACSTRPLDYTRPGASTRDPTRRVGKIL